jgi:hypothetical protein
MNYVDITAAFPNFDFDAAWTEIKTGGDSLYDIESFVATLVCAVNAAEYANPEAANPRGLNASWGMNDKGVATLTIKGKMAQLTFQEGIGGETYPVPTFND